MHTSGSSSCRKLRGFSAALGLLAYNGCYGSATPEDGCQVDLDCKGDRICVDSLCVDPDMAGTAGSGDPTDGVGGVDPVDPGDDVVEGEYPQALPSECSEGAKDYAAKTPADFCPISLVVLVDDGGGGDPVMTEAEVMDEIAFVNTYFADSALSFSVVEVKYYNHDIVLDPDQPKITELNDNDIVAALGKDHIVLAIIDPNKSEYCGRGNLGGTTPTPAAFVVSNCTSLYASTAMVHELGHTLGLPHPFAPFNPLADMPDPALIPGLDDDCYVTGDRMCDTPPDPTKKYCPLVDCEAVCEGDFEAYEPEAGLTMSYYDDECQSPTTAFSQEQKNVMRCVVDKVLPQLGNCEDCAPADYTQCSAGDLYYFDSCNKIGALAQSCDDGNTCTDDSCGANQCQNVAVANGSSCGDAMICKGGSCVGEDVQQCDSGECCSDGVFRPASYVCASEAESEYGCPWGTAPGEDVGQRSRDRYCSGASAACDGEYGAWSGWALAEDCTMTEVCVPGEASCGAGPCMDTYEVTNLECGNYSSANGGGPGGGEIFEVCGDVDSQSGMMSISVQKYDGTTFGDRPYQVRVSADGTEDCGPASNYFVVVDTDPSGIGSGSLSFSFQSNFQPGQVSKNYCVTASTKVGDPGYDGGNAQQKSWWWSEKINVTKTCK